MTCLSRAEVADLAGGMLAGDRAAQAERHVASCATCSALVATSAPAGAALAATAASAPPALAATVAEDAGDDAPRGDGPHPGATIGRYRLRGLLGRGGMGAVYRAFDPELDRDVALKLLRSEGASEEAAQRLVREGRAIARLAHPNVVTVFDVGTHAGQAFVAMELVEGRALDAWIAERPRPWREVLAVFLQAGDGLAAAHAIGMVHRDFKPANVLLGDDGRARVTDFGLARIVTTPEADAAAAPAARPSVRGARADDRMTQTGALVGTPAYMPPEQFDGAQVDARTDQFSFAVSLYEALYQERPFAGATAGEVYASIETGEVRPPPVGTAVPTWLRSIVVRGLRARPDDRHPSLAAMLTALGHAPRARRRWQLGLGAATAACATLGLLAGAGAFASDAPPDCAGQAARQLAPWRALRATLGASDLVAALDASAAAWTTAAIAACRAPAPDPVRRGQVERCLQAEAELIELATADLRAPTPAILEELRALFGAGTGTGTGAARCVTQPRETYPAPLPTDPVLRERARAAYAKARRAAVHGPELSLEGAEALAREALADAEATGHDPTIAHAYSGFGGVLTDRNDAAAAIVAFQKSITHAERGQATATLGLSHVLLAHTVCSLPGRAAECDAEMERAKNYFDAHPDDDDPQFELTYAGYQAVKLAPERGVARLEAWARRRPGTTQDPYYALSLAQNLVLDGRPARALALVTQALPDARATGQPVLVGVMLEQQCLYQLELGDPAGAAATLAVLDAEAVAPELARHRLGCEAALRLTTGDDARARVAADELAVLLAGRSNAWHVRPLLIAGDIDAARVALGPPPPVRPPYDWAALEGELARLDVELATGAGSPARARVATLEAGLAEVPRDAYPWFEVAIRAAIVHLVHGSSADARAPLAHARALVDARGAEASAAARLLVAALEAELCARERSTTCAAPLATALAPWRGAGGRPLEADVATLLAAETSADVPAMCAAWARLGPRRAAPVVKAIDRARFEHRCR